MTLLDDKVVTELIGKAEPVCCGHFEINDHGVYGTERGCCGNPDRDPEAEANFENVSVTFLRTHATELEGLAKDREMLLNVSEQLNNQSWVCPLCHREEDTFTTDVAAELRVYLWDAALSASKERGDG